MKRRKNLERAIVLGLILSTGVYGTALAEELNDRIWGSGIDKLVQDEALIINSSSDAIGYSGKIKVINGDLIISTNGNGVYAGWNKNANLILIADNIEITAGNNGLFTATENRGSGHIFIGEENGRKVNSLTITSKGQGIDNKSGSVAIYGTADSVIDIHSISGSGINKNQAAVNNSKSNGSVIIEGGTIKLAADNGNGITNSSSGTVNIDANESITITAAKKEDSKITADGIMATNGNVDLKSAGNNTIYSDMGNDELMYGKGKAINAYITSKYQASANPNVKLNADGDNTLYGSVYAAGIENYKGVQLISTVNLTAKNGANKVYSFSKIDKAGGLTDDYFKDENGDLPDGYGVYSALYAADGATITLDGDSNEIYTYADNENESQLERTVWAYDTGVININGETDISTNSYELSPDSLDVAVAAGTATGFTEDKVNNFKGDRATVNVNYKGASSITGDILSAYAGEVNIISDNTDSNAKMDIRGNLIAGNNGILNVDLGNGGTLIGRADDYVDADLDNLHADGTTNGFYNSAFSSEILGSGKVNLTMGDNSIWYVTGQSWITTINSTGNATIDLTDELNIYNHDSHALTVGELTGDAKIKMTLDGDRSVSDMLYIKKGTGTYDVELSDVVTVDDMYATYTTESGETAQFTGLRFATVGAGSDVTFNVTASDRGVNNIRYVVETDVYNGETKGENNSYNGGDNTSLTKPGNAAVEDLLGIEPQTQAETPVVYARSRIMPLAANNIALLAEETDAQADENTGTDLTDTTNDTAVNDTTSTDHLNHKLVAMEIEGTTDAGKTIINMSRANYSNAIYMDRLNKRMGEARYINDEEDQGMWVRVRHDRIGKDDAFRSQNTMYELGYDEKQECDNGKRRVGFAVDYMHGDTGYHDISGKGEIDRYGLWLYDTWLGNKGHYVDYVAKWGHLDNEFEIYAPSSGEKISGDYSNNVFSISAEYGRKKDMGSDWYFEPQAQLQLARVTGADYTTSQGSKVSVDGINSLIGRAGFRLGKDFGEEKQSTVYIKADVLHEFLGDQTITAIDSTGTLREEYENEGTWYDVGFGFATQMSKNSYAYLDFEKSFGNDNDETYQINAGVQWTF